MGDTYLIPLKSERSYLRFDVDLSGTVITLDLQWSLIDAFYFTSIEKDGVTLIAGIGFHPNIDLLRFTELKVGSLMVKGKDPTPSNLGISNRLVYESL